MDNNQGGNQGMGGGQGGANPIQAEKFLAGVNYPASKQDLINRARQQGADENVIKSLEGLPEQMYNSPADVSKAMGQEE